MKHNTLSGNLMTLSEIADYLKVAEKTVLRMIQKNEIPCVKIASQWRFDRGLIDGWILDKMNNTGVDELTRLMHDDADSVPLSRLTSEDLIITDLKPGSKEEILRELSRPLVTAGIVMDHEKFVLKLIEREQMISTVLGKGVAMPHIRNPRENLSGKPVVVIGICREGTNFGASDDGPVKLFFLVYTNNEIAHLRIISKINNFLRNFVDSSELIAASTPKEVMRVLLKK
ncbi:MAG: PTS sugar transporter subunit IIA [Spirochaetales bacterium]|nr:PTS sugar transporter subunit IIA [Spirochaetales bacterium]